MLRLKIILWNVKQVIGELQPLVRFTEGQCIYRAFMKKEEVVLLPTKVFQKERLVTNNITLCNYKLLIACFDFDKENFWTACSTVLFVQTYFRVKLETRVVNGH